MSMECFFVNPIKIRVREGLTRSRVEVGDVQSLADSIKNKRQILPVVVTRDLDLIDGGRRVAACILAGKDVKCVYEDVADSAELKELEIEANCHRKDFTPAEKAEAVQEYHRLKQARHGVATSGAFKSGWTMEQTAKIDNENVDNFWDNFFILPVGDTIVFSINYAPSEGTPINPVTFKWTERFL